MDVIEEKALKLTDKLLVELQMRARLDQLPDDAEPRDMTADQLLSQALTLLLARVTWLETQRRAPRGDNISPLDVL